ncbi:MAG TPA: hypothetical protein VM011_01225 [Gammaproteobacteria bacterium]|nr:hypothetical protein [Gammaproteobacteria bacterium]
MRYRIGEHPDLTTGPALDQGAFASIAVLSCLIGIGFVFAGLRSRHYWLTIWGSGLALSSMGYLGFIALT